MIKTYYFPDEQYADAWFWSDSPVCLSMDDIKECAIGWEKSVDELMEQVHEASESEIAEWGICE